MNNASASAQMPTYQSHKKVWALKILSITIATAGGATITPADAGYAPFEVDQPYLDKHKPEAGGYYVVYADGYKSFSPAVAFEAGNTRIGTPIGLAVGRKIESHKVNPVNDTIAITVTDAPGAGGANHRYQLDGMRLGDNPSRMSHDARETTAILFQNGPIPESGVNGVTQEALIAICIDRLECFQAGPYACVENAGALEHLKLAQNCLQMRTKARMARNVEGTHTV